MLVKVPVITGVPPLLKPTFPEAVSELRVTLVTVVLSWISLLSIRACVAMIGVTAIFVADYEWTVAASWASVALVVFAFVSDWTLTVVDPGVFPDAVAKVPFIITPL